MANYTSKHKGSTIDEAIDKAIALVVDSSLSDTSINPLENKAVKYALDNQTHTVEDITDFPTTMTPTSHAHGNITNDGKIGNTSGKILTTSTDGAIQAITGGIDSGIDADKLDGKDASDFTPSVIGTTAGLLLGTGTEGVIEAKTVEALKAILLDLTRPVGSVFESLDSTSPATLFGGTWAAIGAGTFLVAAGTGYAAGSTGGAATHAHTTPIHTHTTGSVGLSIENLPSHNHPVRTISTDTAGGYASVEGSWKAGYNWDSDFSQYTGSGTAHNHGTTEGASPTTNAASTLPPYYAVYIWRRTA